MFWVEVSGNIAHHGAGEGMALGFHFQQGDHQSEAIYILAEEEEAERRSQNGLKPSAMQPYWTIPALLAAVSKVP